MAQYFYFCINSLKCLCFFFSIPTISLPPQLVIKTKPSPSSPIIKLQLGRKVYIIIRSPSIAKQILKYLNTIFANRNIPVAAINEAFGELDTVWRSNGPKLHKLRKLVVLEIMSDKGLNAYYEFRR
ncbi:hypothetical protein GOBAR_AA18706 [Gossypium barbadense]|uniref:Uncharacterized protein n=1 Tax=Gossypium barbadense TaxID=3634 RepID=A0A2P5XF15_GOSBA|nr:hypothetical protein GOBAR_AA18706 [Gossypium barbadense]